jgi:DNA-directed RNA polymerase subunit RPC12/RpoP
MLDPVGSQTYELCFPGSLTGETEISCPHCNTLLTVPVNDPNGQESYQCCKCQKGFMVDWASGQISMPVDVTITLSFQDAAKDAKR